MLSNVQFYTKFEHSNMRLFLFNAIQSIIVHSANTEDVPTLDNGEKEKRSNNDCKQNPVLCMIFNQLDKIQSKIAKIEDENKKINNIVCELQKAKGDTDKITQPNDKKMGSTYVRWGKLKCSGSDIETVYKGQVAGGHYTHSGSGVNYLCLPDDPNIGQKLPSGSTYGYLYGAEYEVFNYNKPAGVKNGIGDHDVPCAVCITKGKMTTLMIPGRRKCYNGWKKEYDGYLMSGHYTHSGASEYACVIKVLKF